jgi:hypothetical protein
MELLEGEIKARQAGYIDMPYFGVDSVWAYGHAGDDLNLILIVPKRIILEQFERVKESLHSLVKEQWLITGVAAIGVILLLMLAGLWFAHAMIRPLFVMVEAVKRLAKGDFSARMNINTGMTWFLSLRTEYKSVSLWKWPRRCSKISCHRRYQTYAALILLPRASTATRLVGTILTFSLVRIFGVRMKTAPALALWWAT